jgi:hypothetical protein
MNVKNIVDTLLTLDWLGYEGRIYDAHRDGVISTSERKAIEKHKGFDILLKSCCASFTKPLPGKRK